MQRMIARHDVTACERHRIAGSQVDPPTNISDTANERWTYEGLGVDLARRLACTAYGGQIVMTQAAWERMGGSLPSGVHMLSLGVVALETEPVPLALMELVPNRLSSRDFEPFAGARVVSPGYRQAPNPDEEMAIVFVATSLPQNIEALHVAEAVLMYADALRNLLNSFEGYECKEPEPGKFTLAFRSFAAALGFAASFHTTLLRLPWPAPLLLADKCGQEMDNAGRLLFRGLRARIGIAFAKPTSRKPLHSGRADYFGPLPNLAARVMGSAQYGQTLLEVSAKLDVQWSEGEAQLDGAYSPTDPVRLKLLGRFRLRGVPQPAVLAYSLPASLEGRVALFVATAGRVDEVDGLPQASVSSTAPVVSHGRSAVAPNRQGSSLLLKLNSNLQ
jgi:class 3 adenylate cyclase